MHVINSNIRATRSLSDSESAQPPHKTSANVIWPVNSGAGRRDTRLRRLYFIDCNSLGYVTDLLKDPVNIGSYEYLDDLLNSAAVEEPVTYASYKVSIVC